MGPISIPKIPELYPALALTGSIVGWRLIKLLRIPSAFDAETSRLYYLLVACAAAIGSFLPSILAQLLGSAEPVSKSVTGALLLGWLGAEYLKLLLGQKRPTGDQLAVLLPCAFCISRWGCLFAHCCYGIFYIGPVALEDGGRACFPIPLLESGFHFLFLGVGIYLTLRNLLPGQRLRLYLGSYACFRFATEGLRPSAKDLWGLSIYQWTCLALFVVITIKMLTEARTENSTAATVEQAA